MTAAARSRVRASRDAARSGIVATGSLATGSLYRPKAARSSLEREDIAESLHYARPSNPGWNDLALLGQRRNSPIACSCPAFCPVDVSVVDGDGYRGVEAGSKRRG